VHPESTTWKAPSSVCGSDSSTCTSDSVTTAWNANSDQVEDMVNRIDHITTTTYYNTGDAK
jgi:hypothetical protein